MKIQKINKEPSGVLFSPEGSKNIYILSVSNGQCCFNLDYSPYIGHECNSCDFCYNKCVDFTQSRQYLSNKIFSGNSINYINEPITVGRYHDIFRNDYMKNNILMFLREALKTNHKLIIIIVNDNIPSEFYDLCDEYSDNISIQIKVFTDSSSYGKALKDLFAYKLPDISKFNVCIAKFLEYNINVSIRIDPVILNINSDMIDNIVRHFNNVGINSFIIKPLCATHSFKSKISLISRRYASLLSDVYDKYSLYSTDNIFDYIAPIVLRFPNSIFTFCENVVLNKIFNQHENCCQFNGNIDE